MIDQLEPASLWTNFSDLNSVPRPSKKEERVIEFMLQFARSRGLEVSKDSTGNVLIKKPAQGRRGRPTVALQSHLDMVHQKNADTPFDFEQQGIEMTVEGDWVKARGTTLGADNGIGVAAMMAVLDSKELAHPALEALFTVDEETGMTGVKGVAPGTLSARYLLNLDTEEDTELTIGCAGGVDVVGTGTFQESPAPAGATGFRIQVSGLTGGHSGMDIHRGRANANKVMNRILLAGANSCGLRVATIDGGGLRNAIPRESTAQVTVSEPDAFQKLLTDFQQKLGQEYRTTDPDFSLSWEPITVGRVIDRDFQNRLLHAVATLPNGIYRMSPEVEGLVQTSNNLARVLVADQQYRIGCLSRSAVDSEKDDLATSIESALWLLGADRERFGHYPGWAPRPDCDLVVTMREVYRDLFRQEPDVRACHAGLECGLLGESHPQLEMVSFGPNIRGAHSPDEAVQVSSVQKFWTYLTAALERL